MPESIASREAVGLYLRDREPEVPESTYRNHKYHLLRFLKWCDETEFNDMGELTGEHIYEYKIHRRDEGDVNEVTLSDPEHVPRLPPVLRVPPVR